MSVKIAYSNNTLSSHPKKIIHLSVLTESSGMYTISQSEVAAFDPEYSVLLEDKLMIAYTDLKNQNHTFSNIKGEEKNGLIYYIKKTLNRQEIKIQKLQ
jgi:hypothetical protein